MTTNQTIDGVPRDLLERACVNIFRTTGGQKVVDELRALLYTPTVESELDRLRAENERLLAGFYQQVTDADINKISDYMGNPDMPTGAFLRQDAYDLANMTTHMCREVQALRNKLAAQSQGEPVAYVDYSASGGVRWRPWEHGNLADGAPLFSGSAEQPAPVAVVMPERRAVSPARMSWEKIVALVNEVLGCEAHKWPVPDVGHVMTGINFNSLARIIDRIQSEQDVPVALDRPTHANPPPGTEPSGTHHDNDGLDEIRKP